MIRRSRVPVRIPVDPAVLGYVAGLIDGEGNLTISKSIDRKKGRHYSYTPTLQIGNTDPRMTAWLRGRLGGSVDQVTAPARLAKPHWKPLHRWRLHGSNVDLVLVAVLPYLVTKRDQAELILRFRAIRGMGRRPHGALSAEEAAAREAMKLELNHLNRKGASS
jgi:hypothetical protein